MSAQHFLSNCFMLVIPVLVWNLFLGKALPSSYQSGNWNRIQKPIAIAENTLRIVVFVSSLFLSLEIRTEVQLLGLIVYVAGVLAYFTSWILQIFKPESSWSRSLVGFCAPAYTAMAWLLGIALIGQHLVVDAWYTCWIYALLAALFVTIHTSHATMAFRNSAGRSSSGDDNVTSK